MNDIEAAAEDNKVGAPEAIERGVVVSNDIEAAAEDNKVRAPEAIEAEVRERI